MGGQCGGPRILETGSRWLTPERRSARVEFSRGHLIPVKDFAKEASALMWPPGGHLFPNSVSMEAESFQYFEHLYGRLPNYGPIHWGTATFLDFFHAIVLLAPDIHFSSPGPPLRIPQHLRYDREGYIILGVIKAAPCWGETFAPLFPTGGGLDDLIGRRKIVEVARLSATDLNGALEEARTQARPYISDAWIPRALSWLGPTAVGGRDRGNAEEAVLTEAESRFGISFESLEDARKSPQWRDVLETREKVSRVWGMTGLFWALLIEQLETGRRFNECYDCGRIIHGRKGKRYCGRVDDPACYRRRRAADKRRSREDE